MVSSVLFEVLKCVLCVFGIVFVVSLSVFIVIVVRELVRQIAIGLMEDKKEDK